MTNFKPEVVESWLAYGSPEQCITRLRQGMDVGIKMITMRLTGWDQMGLLKRCMEEVLPATYDYGDVLSSPNDLTAQGNRSSTSIPLRRRSLHRLRSMVYRQVSRHSRRAPDSADLIC